MTCVQLFFIKMKTCNTYVTESGLRMEFLITLLNRNGDLKLWTKFHEQAKIRFFFSRTFCYYVCHVFFGAMEFGKAFNRDEIIRYEMRVRENKRDS